MQEKTFVISLGGSIIVPEEIDEKFLKKFRDFILKKVSLGYKFIIITGGGRTCRKYQQAAVKICNATQMQEDLIGIESTKLNSMLMQTILGKYANPILLDKKDKVKNFGKYPIIVGCGWDPGHSTDFNAALLALKFGSKIVINLSNQDYVYTADPRKDKNAKVLENLTWQEFFKVSPQKRAPGMNTPFDPAASRLAQKNNLKVIMANGRNLPNLEKILSGKPFKGTTIS